VKLYETKVKMMRTGKELALIRGISTLKMGLVALPLALILGLAIPTAASAAEDLPAQTLSEEQISNIEILTAATTRGDELTFDAVLAGELGASPESIAEYQAAFTQATSVGIDPLVSRSLADDRTTALRACAGRSGYTGFFPSGSQVALDSCQTAILIAGMGTAAAGGGVYAIASTLTVVGLPAAAVTGFVAALVAFGAGFVTICQAASSNGGIYLNSGGIIPPSCWGQ
jgi:hypothetical protein